MKKIGTKLLVVLAVALGGVAASQEPTTAKASTTFSSIPSGHFQSSKAHYAFHWQTMKSGKNKGQVLVFGNFDKPSVQLGVPNKYKLSKNHRTLTTYYRLMSSKGKLEKTTYRMDVYKYSSSKYRVKLNQYKAGLLPSSKGSAYTFNVTKKSPAQNYATKYTKPKLFNAEYKPTYDANYKSNYETNYKSAYNAYLNEVISEINKGAQQDYKDGKNGDPSTPEAQQDIKNAALKYVNDNTDKITQAVTQNVTKNVTKRVTQEVNKDVNKSLENLVSAYNNLK
ncbi:hypothetical protein [Secundilactobacillus silagei]|uniref:Uncharacterized protein n=1 Tax=Secundilactobacillus silagei JCM 19001 TaxID=1302250 RepID=A0A1Z5H3G0_9LACO|nr:hypothetical protein [Secundilactobacillus silagei]TDG70378.1 hypothetical protein C5L25_001568 [Secundilactobacillus silagei JCM 19001]GAT17850.1 hypothetical protein IWT126_00107 [Secundilactobacillus silagei JCM 19001]